MKFLQSTFVAASFFFSALAFTSQSAQAACTFPQLKTKIEDARKSLVELLGGKTTPEQQKLVKETADNVSICLGEIKVPKGKDKDFTELKGAWDSFKSTREKELVPNILAGKIDDARKIATGIQKERLDKMMRLILSLQGGDL